jgi:hypothetical protein
MTRNLWVDTEMLIPPNYFQWHLITAQMDLGVGQEGRQAKGPWVRGMEHCLPVSMWHHG